MQTTAVRLTDAQVAVLRQLWDHLAIVGADATINPIEVFPARDATDNARRRTCDRLCELGILARAAGDSICLYRLVPQAAIAAYCAWVKRQPGGRRGES